MPPSTIDLAHIRSLTWTVSSSYTASSIILYNLALGASGTALPLVFEQHSDFHALPTFGTLPVISAMGAVTKSMPDFLPGFQPHNHVHGEHYLQLRRPFPVPNAGEEVQLVTIARVLDVVERSSGVTVCVGITSRKQASGEEICYNEWTSFILKVPGNGASSYPSQSLAPADTPQIPDRPPDRVLEHRTSPEQSALYRAASGDLNPLHIDPEVAKRGGFAGPILTGTCTLGMGVKHVIDAFAGGDVARFASVKVRLSKPVFPCDEVRTEMWKVDGGEEGGGVVYRQCVGERVVMRDGFVKFKRRGGGKSRGEWAARL